MRNLPALGWVGLAAAAVSACGADANPNGWDEIGGSNSGTTTSTTTTTTSTSTSTTTGTGAAGGEGGSGQAGSGGDPGTGASGGQASCEDLAQSEPNETEETAFSLAVDPISDCDGSGGELTGVIAGPNDVDWFKYRGDDTSTCTVDATATLQTDEPALRLCMYVECLSANVQLDACPAGTSDATSPGGRLGCCGYASFALGFDCLSTMDDDATIYLSLDVPGATASTCGAYTVTYHY